MTGIAGMGRRKNEERQWVLEWRVLRVLAWRSDHVSYICDCDKYVMEGKEYDY